MLLSSLLSLSLFAALPDREHIEQSSVRAGVCQAAWEEYCRDYFGHHFLAAAEEVAGEVHPVVDFRAVAEEVGRAEADRSAAAEQEGAGEQLKM